MRPKTGASRFNGKHRGIALIWLVISFMALLAFMTLAVEASRIYFAAHELQNAADAAALAGSRLVAWDPNSVTKIVARLKAQEYALLNEAANMPVKLNLNSGNNPSGDIVIGSYIPQYATDGDPATIPFNPTLQKPNAMKAVTRRDGTLNPELPLILGSVFKVSSVKIEKYAIAMIQNSPGAAIIALSDTGVGLLLSGTPDLAISNGGSIQVNSTFSNALDTNGDPLSGKSGKPSLLSEINVVGDYDIKPKVMGYIDTVNEGNPAPVTPESAAMADPLSVLNDSYTTSPDLGTIALAGTATSPQVYSPGYYSGGISKPDKAPDGTQGYIVLQAGVYHLDGAGIDIANANCTILAEGVLLHLVGDSSVNIQGGNLTLSPPTTGDYAGVSIFQSRSNTNDAFIAGNGGLNMTGTLYFPQNHLEIKGNGDTIGTQLIANTIEIGGTGLINIPYNGTPEVALTSFLVE